MTINGKEYGFFYSIWAHCELNDWIVKHPNSSYASAMVQKALIMSKAYADAHGGPVLTSKDLMHLPKVIFDDLCAEMDAAEKRDSERTVESAPTGKNAVSSGK